MHPKMFASLVDVIEKWSNDAVDMREWQNDNHWWPEDAALNMAKAAAIVYDATVSASNHAEEEMQIDPLK